MKTKYKTLDELPVTLSATDIAETLGLSRAGAYNLLNIKGFPTLQIGSRKLVMKQKFIEWINNHTGGEKIETVV
jgi:predicted DNA-binding transcriptional regulator AlpA